MLSGCFPNQQKTEKQEGLAQTQIDPDSDATLLPSSTPIPTIASTPTVIPIPTLDFENQADVIEYLFATNNSCEFPCWWGIVPGETKWLAAEEFLKPLAVEIEHFEYLWYLKDGAKEHKIVLEVPTALDPDGLGSITMVEDWWGYVRSISIATNFSALGLDIKNFLNEFGYPDEVYIFTSGSSTDFLEGGSIFTIGIYYEKVGVLMAYFGISDKVARTDPGVDICISGVVDDVAWLELWDATQEMSFDEVSTPGLNAGGEMEFKPISEISDLTPEIFYERASKTAPRDYCFEVSNPGYAE